MKRKWIIALSILLLTFTLACSAFGEKSTPEPAATTAPPVAEDTKPPKQDDEDTTASSTEDDEKPFTLDADALSGLDSYRLQMEWNFTDNDGSTQTFTIEQEATRDPSAQRFVVTSDQEQNIEFIQIEETQWVRFGDEWVQTSADTEDAMEGFGSFFIEPETMLSGINDGDYEDLGRETVNGVKTRHLRAKAETWSVFGALDSAEIEKGVIDLWVVDEPDLPQFVIRFEMEVEGKVEDNVGKLEMTWEVLDINEPFIIEPPAEAEDMGLPGDVPLCPDASDMTVMGTMTMLTCEGKVADVNEFYTSQLTTLGWEKTQSADMENMFTSSWEKGEETIQLTIMASDSGSDADVMIMTGE